MLNKIISLFLILSMGLVLSSNLLGRERKENSIPLITLTEGNFYALSGKVDYTSTNKLVEELYTKPGTEYTIYIDSPGGNVFAGLEVVKAIQNSGKTVTCIADMAISMAFTIFQQCHVRHVTDGAVLMQHLMSYGVQGDYRHNLTRAEFSAELATHLQTLDSSAIEMDIEKFVNYTRDDWWLIGQKAIDNGAADSMVRLNCDKSLYSKVISKKEETAFFQVEYVMSGCPLIRSPLEERTVQKYEKVPPKEKQEFEDLLTRLNPLLFIQALHNGSIRPEVDWNQK